MTIEIKKEKRPRNAEVTRQKIMQAARLQFSKHGFDGARIDKIASMAKVNKQLIYHYYGSKDGLFTAVLEEAYYVLRTREAALELDSLSADQAVLALVESSWRHYLAHPEFIRLLNSENQLEARHFKDMSPKTQELHRQHAQLMERLLERGVREKTIRSDIDPVQLNISIAALGFFYLLNRYTLSKVYQQDLGSSTALETRLSAMKDTISCWIRPVSTPTSEG